MCIEGQLDLFDAMEYYPREHQTPKEEVEVTPLLVKPGDFLCYPIARKEVERLTGKAMAAACGYYPKDEKVRWYFTLSPDGSCYIDETLSLYEFVRGEKEAVCRGKVDNSVLQI